MYWESRLFWNQHFDVHSLGALLVFTTREQRTANAGSLQLSLPSRNVSLAGRVTYGYDDRYFAEFNFGYNGSERFSKEHRWGFFPSMSFGWMVSNEKFFKPLENVITKLKLRYSYGLVGNDNIGSSTNRFFYLSEMNMSNNKSGQSYFGNNLQTTYNGITFKRYANAAITWERSKKQNFGVELQLFKNLDIIAEYYTEKRTDIYMARADIPSSMGLQTAISANIGEASAHGVDIQLEYKQNWNKDLWTSARGNFTFARSKYEVYEEPTYAESYRQHKGYSINQKWGYIAERLFIDDEEAANSPSQAGFGSQYGGGDIKYTDVNKDGVINQADMVPIGNPTSPEFIYGFGFSVGYKGFDCSVFFQGLANESFWINASGYSSKNKGGMAPFYQHTQLLKSIADDHWSEDNRNLYAFWPRLSTYLNNNNTPTSTWWMRDGSFLRLKQMELGYTVPRNLTKKWHMDSLRFYVSGTNLLNWSSFKMWDPEQGASALNYPLQRTINIGLNVTFQ
jgi:TonB-linked SusC/RagA family outer membrane protein